MNNQILSRLKELKKGRGDTSAFANHDEFLSWDDRVAPLLEFDEALYNNFAYYSGQVKTAYRMGREHHDALGESIGVVNQAITKLELQSEQVPTGTEAIANEIAYPQKFTLKWLYQHASIRIWASFFGLLIMAFSFGVGFSETQLYQLLKNKSSDSVAASALNKSKQQGPSGERH
jgi:hypothetical protein